MRPDYFFTERYGSDDPLAINADPWRKTIEFDQELANRLRQRPLPDVDDLDAAMALTELVHDDLEHFGTSGYVRLSDEELGITLRALRAVLKRLDIAFEVPFVGSPGTGPQPCGGTGGPKAGGPQPSGGRSGGCWDKVPSLSAIWTRTVERVRAALRLQADCRSITRQGNLAKQSQ